MSGYYGGKIQLAINGVKVPIAGGSITVSDVEYESENEANADGSIHSSNKTKLWSMKCDLSQSEGFDETLLNSTCGFGVSLVTSSCSYIVSDAKWQGTPEVDVATGKITGVEIMASHADVTKIKR